MDVDRKKKLEEMLASGKMSDTLYNEIMKRWEEVDSSGEEKNEEAADNMNIKLGSLKFEWEERKDEETKEEPRQERSKKIKLSGLSRMSSVYAEELSVSGSITVEGTMDSNCMDISGSCRVEKDVISSDTIDSSGSMRIGGNVKANRIDSSGSLRVQGAMEVVEMDSSGSIVAESVKCEEFKSSGSANIAHAISARNIDTSGKTTAESIDCITLKSSGTVEVETLKGEELYFSGRVRAKSVNATRFQLKIYEMDTQIERLEAKIVEVTLQKRKFFSGGANIDEILCSRASLESTKSRYVKGDEIFIGAGCVIDYVEAKTIEISDNARVKEKKIVT